MKRICLAVFLCAFSICAAQAEDKPCRPAKHAPVPEIKGLTYHSARQSILAAGWQPVQTHDGADDDPDTSSGNGEIFWKKGYVEIEACAGTGVAPCAFLFKDVHGNKLRVTTQGEETPEEKHYATVNSFYFVCEDAVDQPI